MKVRLAYTVEVTDEYRRAINRFYGRPGLADRDEVKRWFRAYGESMNDDLAAYYSADPGDLEEVG